MMVRKLPEVSKGLGKGSYYYGCACCTCMVTYTVAVCGNFISYKCMIRTIHIIIHIYDIW